MSDDEGEGEAAKDEDKKTKVLKKKKESKVKFSPLKTGEKARVAMFDCNIYRLVSSMTGKMNRTTMVMGR